MPNDMDMLEAHPVDVLLALIRVEESIQAWKAAVVDLVRKRAETMSIAQGPFRPGGGPQPPGPPPPFSGCEGEFLGPPPFIGCEGFNIDTYVQQVSELFLGLYFGLEHDQRSPTRKTS